MIIFIVHIDITKVNLLEETYKEVFSGYPWYEDLACKNCNALYTKREIREDSKERVYPLRDLNKCLQCDSPLELISYYPEIVNQKKLIKEAMLMNGFIGYLALFEDTPIGFSWGYKVPPNRTQSVNFSLITSLLDEKNINPQSAFYGAETGVIETYQSKGIGSVLVSKRILEAARKGYEFFIFRTINPKMRNIISDLFSGIPPVELFKDPETKSPWFFWNFKDFDYNVAENKIQRKK